MSSINKRNSSLDILRIIAVISVIAVHFFLNTGFYDTKIEGKFMFMACILRTYLMQCVPLFMVLTGYLMCKKHVSQSYYSGIIKTLLTYVFASLAIAFYRIYSGTPLTKGQIFWGIFSFSDAPNSWYVEMYIGLFCLIPFLNVMYNGLESQKSKQWLVVTMLIITSLPQMTNIFQVDTDLWWKHLISASGNQKILPEFWNGLYPVTYYFLGCYAREFQLKIKTKWLALILGIHLVLAGGFNFVRSFGQIFIWGPWQQWGSPINTITTILTFALVARIRTSGWNIHVKQIIKFLSERCFGIYLLSYIADDIIYTGKIQILPGFRGKMLYFVPSVVVNFLYSLILSTVIYLFVQCTLKMYILIKSKIKKVPEAVK